MQVQYYEVYCLYGLFLDMKVNNTCQHVCIYVLVYIIIHSYVYMHVCLWCMHVLCMETMDSYVCSMCVCMYVHIICTILYSMYVYLPVQMNPPVYVPLVEVIPSVHTSQEVVQRTINLMKNIGKSLILEKKEISGFVVNRLQYAIIVEAWRLVEVCMYENFKVVM